MYKSVGKNCEYPFTLLNFDCVNSCILTSATFHSHGQRDRGEREREREREIDPSHLLSSSHGCMQKSTLTRQKAQPRLRNTHFTLHTLTCFLLRTVICRKVLQHDKKHSLDVLDTHTHTFYITHPSHLLSSAHGCMQKSASTRQKAQPRLRHGRWHRLTGCVPAPRSSRYGKEVCVCVCVCVCVFVFVRE